MFFILIAAFIAVVVSVVWGCVHLCVRLIIIIFTSFTVLIYSEYIIIAHYIYTFPKPFILFHSVTETGY